MKLIVGLGNHGEKYENTKHNLGFEVVEKLKEEIQRDAGVESRTNKQKDLEIFYGSIGEEEVDLVKPQTYMNNSGWAVSEFARRSNLSYQNDLIVVHDDISLELGQIKISEGAGAGNHNGVKSIIDHLKTKNFIRVRCGIGRGDGVLSDVVLSKFRPDEIEIVRHMIQKAADACVTIVQEGVEKAMNEFNAFIP